MLLYSSFGPFKYAFYLALTYVGITFLNYLKSISNSRQNRCSFYKEKPKISHNLQRQHPYLFQVICSELSRLHLDIIFTLIAKNIKNAFWIFAFFTEMPNIENFGQYQYQDQYQVDFFLPILGLVLGLAPKKVPNILEIVLEKGLGFVFFK